MKSAIFGFFVETKNSLHIRFHVIFAFYQTETVEVEDFLLGEEGCLNQPPVLEMFGSLR